MYLIRSIEAHGRANRMLKDLEGHNINDLAFTDRLPYVLDLLAGITRTIDAETRGHRTPEFGAWWASVDRSAQRAIQEMRNAELKELRSETRAARFVSSHVHEVTRFFASGAFAGKPVLETLWEYELQMFELIAEAEIRLRR